MSCIHYKFRSSLEYKTLTFEGLNISVAELKRLIYENEKINRSSDFDLQITNAQTKQIYEEDNTMVPRNASVTVARIPAIVHQKLPKVWDRSTEGVVQKNTLRMGDLSGSTSSMLSEKNDLSKKSDLTEEEKIKEMERLATSAYDPSTFVKRRATMIGLPPMTYICNRCHQTGHWIMNCPMVNVRRTTGIPKDELMETTPDDPQAMLTAGGNYVVSRMHKTAKLQGKKERPPFLEDENLNLEPEEKREIPNGYLCAICNDLLKDAMFIKCCGTSFCADCITNLLLESEKRVCPNCQAEVNNPDKFLFPNVKLRDTITSFRKETFSDIRKRLIQRERSHSSTPPPHSSYDNSLPLRNSSLAYQQHQKSDISTVEKTTYSGGVHVTTTYFPKSGSAADVTTSSGGEGDRQSSANNASSSGHVTSTTAAPPVQIVQPTIVSPPHPMAVVLPQPTYTAPAPIAVSRSAQQQQLPPPQQTVSSNTALPVTNLTAPAATIYSNYPVPSQQPVQTASQFQTTPVVTVAPQQQSGAYPAAYSSQPPPPGISTNSFSALPSFSRPPPTLAPTQPSVAPHNRPLTEEEFYLEKSRRTAALTSTSSAASRDPWEEFLARKDRKKIRSSSRSSSESSDRSRRTRSRTSSRSRSRSRSPRPRRGGKYRSGRRSVRRYSRSRSRTRSSSRRRVRRKSRSRTPRSRTRSPLRSLLPHSHSSSSFRHYHHVNAPRSPEHYYPPHHRPFVKRPPDFMSSYPPPPTAPPPAAAYYGGYAPAGPPPPVTYATALDPRYLKIHYPAPPYVDTVQAPPGVSVTPLPPGHTVMTHHPSATDYHMTKMRRSLPKLSETYESPATSDDESPARPTVKDVPVVSESKPEKEKDKKRPTSTTPLKRSNRSTTPTTTTAVEQKSSKERKSRKRSGKDENADKPAPKFVSDNQQQQRASDVAAVATAAPASTSSSKKKRRSSSTKTSTKLKTASAELSKEKETPSKSAASASSGKTSASKKEKFSKDKHADQSTVAASATAVEQQPPPAKKRRDSSPSSSSKKRKPSREKDKKASEKSKQKTSEPSSSNVKTNTTGSTTNRPESVIPPPAVSVATPRPFDISTVKKLDEKKATKEISSTDKKPSAKQRREKSTVAVGEEKQQLEPAGPVIPPKEASTMSRVSDVVQSATTTVPLTESILPAEEDAEKLGKLKRKKDKKKRKKKHRNEKDDGEIVPASVSVVATTTTSTTAGSDEEFTDAVGDDQKPKHHHHHHHRHKKDKKKHKKDKKRSSKDDDVVKKLDKAADEENEKSNKTATVAPSIVEKQVVASSEEKVPETVKRATPPTGNTLSATSGYVKSKWETTNSDSESEVSSNKIAASKLSSLPNNGKQPSAEKPSTSGVVSSLMTSSSSSTSKKHHKITLAAEKVFLDKVPKPLKSRDRKVVLERTDQSTATTFAEQPRKVVAASKSSLSVTVIDPISSKKLPKIDYVDNALPSKTIDNRSAAKKSSISDDTSTTATTTTAPSSGGKSKSNKLLSFVVKSQQLKHHRTMDDLKKIAASSEPSEGGKSKKIGAAVAATTHAAVTVATTSSESETDTSKQRKPIKLKRK